MDKKTHLVAGIAIAVTWYYFVHDAWACVVMGIIGALLPDVDTGPQHRFWLWHSILPGLGCFVYALVNNPAVRLADASVLCLCIAGHLLLDLKWKNRSGTYCITIHKGDRMSARHTDWWLILNAAAGIILSLIAIVSR